MQVTKNVIEFMAKKISHFPKNTREILKICACIGNRFDLELFLTQILHGSSSVAQGVSPVTLGNIHRQDACATIRPASRTPHASR